jgi:TolB protein
MAADGGGRRELLIDAAGGTWSPDGHRLAFYGFGSRAAGIYVTDPDGRDVTKVDKGCGDDCTDAPTRWSPDGQYLAFTRQLPEGTPTVGIMRSDGSEARLLLPTLYTGGPVWSPDGQQVALTRFDWADEAFRIYVVTLATADTVRLAPFGSVSDWTR